VFDLGPFGLFSLAIVRFFILRVAFFLKSGVSPVLALTYSLLLLDFFTSSVRVS